MIAIQAPRLTPDLGEIACGIINCTAGTTSVVSVNDMRTNSQVADLGV